MTTLRQLCAFVLLSALVATKAGAARAAASPDYGRWAVVLVAGDNRAHSGRPSQVFDNARRDLATGFTKFGFKAENTVQFSLNDAPGVRHISLAAIVDGMKEVTDRAPAGCLIYFTSHGTPDGMMVGGSILTPDDYRAMLAQTCRERPTVIVMSSCYSGQFVEPLKADSRIVMTAARPDRTSFGCGEMDRYTYFDDCFLQAMPMSHDFADLGGRTRQCVAAREAEMHVTRPSEPQLAIGAQGNFSLDGAAVPSR